MEETIKGIIAQADDERNFDLIRWVKDILDEFASTYNCPMDWRYIGVRLAEEYAADSWVSGRSRIIRTIPIFTW